MGYEMIKDKLVITPQRLLSMAQLVHQLGHTKRDELLNLLQPDSIADNRETAGILHRYARLYRLIIEDGNSAGRVSLGVSPSIVASAESFRRHMQGVLLGATQESDDNFLLSQFTAWYATQDEQVMTYTKLEYEQKFHEALYPNATGRVLAEEPGISAWRTWAEFLGWGWPLKFERREEMRIVPDATLRLRPLLPVLLPESGVEVPMAAFVQRLGEHCPELDGGVLFARCWEAARSGEFRGNRLSLMVSTALRVLNGAAEVELIRRADSPDVWTLFPSQSYMNQVTHIRREKAR